MSCKIIHDILLISLILDLFLDGADVLNPTPAIIPPCKTKTMSVLCIVN